MTRSGIRIMPNSMLATTSFTNLSRPPGTHKLSLTTTFSAADPPDRVCAMLSRVAGGLPQLKPDSAPRWVHVGSAEYRTSIGLNSPADDGTPAVISTLAEGSFPGLTALTRQPNLASAYALGQVTALAIDREHLEPLVMREPLLLQNFGRILEERRNKVRREGRGERVG